MCFYTFCKGVFHEYIQITSSQSRFGNCSCRRYGFSYRSSFNGYVVAAFYDEELAYDYAKKRGKGYIVECFIGPKKVR